MKKCFENYPAGMVLASITAALLIYAIGTIVISKLGCFWVAVYVLYILFLEIRLMRRSCVNCYYYDKYCAFGKGKLAALFLRKGDGKRFQLDCITWKDIIPDFLVSLVPLVAGIVLLIVGFTWLLLALVVLLAVLAFPVTGFIRGGFACRHCKQREIGCPAERLFKKK